MSLALFLAELAGKRRELQGLDHQTQPLDPVQLCLPFHPGSIRERFPFVKVDFGCRGMFQTVFSDLPPSVPQCFCIVVALTQVSSSW